MIDPSIIFCPKCIMYKKHSCILIMKYTNLLVVQTNKQGVWANFAAIRFMGKLLNFHNRIINLLMYT